MGARWEWRAFGDGFGGAEDRFGEPERVQESDEVYLVSRLTDANVKVRDGLLDVKELEHVDTAGLEQWAPVLKAEFPVAADQVAAVLERLSSTGWSSLRSCHVPPTRSTSCSTRSWG